MTSFKKNSDFDSLLTEYQLNNSEYGLVRVPMEAENTFLNRIRQGDYHHVKFQDYEVLAQNMGSLSKNKFKHFEYTTVTGIALGCRAAIDGGLAPDIAYDISDISLQKLEKCKTIEEMHDLLVETTRTFAKKVFQSRQTRSSYIIEQCKIYIQRNIFKKIYLKDLAEFVGVHPAYLSRVFSEKVNMTIQSYIQSEKIEVAAHLLTYSDRSIVDIAQYIGFQSQSNFATVFKKWKFISPSKFRNQSRITDMASKEVKTEEG